MGHMKSFDIDRMNRAAASGGIDGLIGEMTDQLVAPRGTLPVRSETYVRSEIVTDGPTGVEMTLRFEGVSGDALNLNLTQPEWMRLRAELDDAYERLRFLAGENNDLEEGDLF